MRGTSTRFSHLDAQQYGTLDDVRLTTLQPSLVLRRAIVPGLSAQMTTGVRYQLGGPNRSWPFYHNTFRLGFGLHGRLSAW